MLPKARRLRLTRDFERVFATGKTSRGRFFRLRSLLKTGSQGRFAVVVSTKVSKRAVVRNRIRRRAWTVIARLAPTLPSSTDMAIVAAPEAAQADFEEQRQDLEFLLTKQSTYRS